MAASVRTMSKRVAISPARLEEIRKDVRIAHVPYPRRRPAPQPPDMRLRRLRVPRRDSPKMPRAGRSPAMSPTSPIRSPPSMRRGGAGHVLSRCITSPRIGSPQWHQCTCGDAEDRLRADILYHERRAKQLKDALRDLEGPGVRAFNTGSQFRVLFTSTPRAGSGIAAQTFEVGSTDGASTAYVYERVLRGTGSGLEPHHLIVDASARCDRVFVTAHAALLSDAASRSAVVFPANFCGARFAFEGNVPQPVTCVGERRGDVWFGSAEHLFVVLSEPMTVVRVAIKDLPPDWRSEPSQSARHEALVRFVRENRVTLTQPACTVRTHYGRTL